MQKKYKYLKVSFLILPLLLIGISFATIAMGADAPPPTSEVKELEGVTGLGGYTSKVFDIAMGLAGGLAGLAFIIGVVQYMVASTQGNSAAAGEGKTKMISALLGLTLTLGSLIVLKAINPNFGTVGVKQELAFTDFPGVYLSKDPVGTTPGLKTAYTVPIPATSAWVDYTGISYICAENVDQKSLPYYFFIGYTGENYTGTPTKKILSCSSSGIGLIGYSSFQLVLIKPGIYLFSDDNCKNILNTNPLTSSTNIGQAKSISIINSTDSYYMVSAHQSIDFQGDCTDFYDKPITPPQGIPPCQSLDTPEITAPASLTIVRLNTTSSAGNGITFYQDTSYKGGVTVIDKSKIETATKSHQSYKISDVKTDIQGPSGISETKFNYSLVSDTLPQIENICPNLSELGQINCPGSAKVYGNYVIKLKAVKPRSTNQPAPASTYCKVFSNSDNTTDFRLDKETLFGNSRKLESIEILQGTK